MNKLFQKKRTFWAMAALSFFILVSPLHAKKKEKETEAAAPAPATADLSMPSGWSDTILKKLTNTQDPRRTIAVFYFTGTEKIPAELGISSRSLADMASDALRNSGKFIVVELDKFDSVMEETGRQMSIEDALKNAPELGQLLSADALVFGDVTGANVEDVTRVSFSLRRTKVQVHMRIVDATTAEIIASDQNEGVIEKKVIYDSAGNLVAGKPDSINEYTDACKQAIQKAAVQLAAQFPLVGYVVNVSGDQVMIRVSAARSVQPGFHFLIFRAGEAITDPFTGQRISGPKQTIGLMEIESVEENAAHGRVLKLKDPNQLPQVKDLVIQK